MTGTPKIIKIEIVSRIVWKDNFGKIEHVLNVGDVVEVPEKDPMVPYWAYSMGGIWKDEAKQIN